VANPVCTPNTSASCTASGGLAGLQTCKSDGSGWNSCVATQVCTPYATRSCTAANGWAGTQGCFSDGSGWTNCLYASGIYTRPCGCWGAATVGAHYVQPACFSGTEHPMACTGSCYDSYGYYTGSQYDTMCD
jgi:hypothetical protein